MSQAVIMAQKGAIDTSFTLLNQFIEVCPDEIWREKSGGWPVWQQVYHCISAVSFFTGLNEGIPSLAEESVSGLEKAAEETVDKAKVKEALQAAQATVEKYVSSITDADLTKRNEPVYAAIEWDISHAFTLSMLAAHNLYHLGSCDAALRNHGLKGVF
ncbi:DinB family protein [Deltaproteobacteria bacterium Smac51]|nr:DinB family protein [Deltaproteobacteria bacterium Smac51]